MGDGQSVSRLAATLISLAGDHPGPAPKLSSRRRLCRCWDLRVQSAGIARCSKLEAYKYLTRYPITNQDWHNLCWYVLGLLNLLEMTDEMI